MAIYTIFDNILLKNKTAEKNVKKLADLRTNKKYVVYECHNNAMCGGLVDRFKGVINAYAWSLFTGRQLIVNILKPCFFENLMIPNDVNWNLKLNQLVNNGELSRNYTRYKLKKIDNHRFKTQLSRIDIKNFENNTDVISLYSNLEWISGYAKNG